MIIRSEELKRTCSILTQAVDSNELAQITETLELKVVDSILYMNVTNREYFAQVKIPVDEYIEFHATVNATLFLKLVSQITTDTIELEVSGTYLLVKGNGTYKLPLVFDNDTLLSLPEITIHNITNTFNIDSSILMSILNYNSKQMATGTMTKPCQKFYYLDEQGALTFTSGACVNSFTLEAPIRILLNNRLVKLFKLFKDSQVKFSIGYDSLTDEIIQTKVRFESENIVLTAILSCDDSLLKMFPVDRIRALASKERPYSITINRDALVQTINRLLLFSTRENLVSYSTFEFKPDELIVYDVNKENKEVIKYHNKTSGITDKYTTILDLNELKITLENCIEQYLTITFGDNTAIVIARPTIKNVVPEIKAHHGN